MKKEQVLAKIRGVKAEYYEKFKKILPIEIEQKAGITFDKSQNLEQGEGGLIKEITKGYTLADIRKIVINNDELQLSISKIKEIVKENEEIVKRDNAKAVDITANRPLTTVFYTELEKENKVDILKPDATLIKSAIDEKSDDKKKDEVKKAEKVAGATASKGGATKAKASAKTAGSKTAGGAKPKPVTKSKAAGAKKQEVKSNTAGHKVNVDMGSSIIYGTGTGTVQSKQAEPNNLIDELMEDDRGVAKESAKTKSEETFVHAIDELTR